MNRPADATYRCQHRASARPLCRSTRRLTCRSTAAACFLVILPSAAILAEQPFESVPRFERLGVEDGLPHSTVWTAMQDERGFMWFGTDDGLSRFDGYDFETYKHDSLKAESLSANSVLSLAQDPQGRLWIGTYGGGVNLFDRHRKTFSHFRHDPQDTTSLSHDVVFALLPDEQGNLWVGSRGGLDRIDLGSGQLQRLPKALIPAGENVEPRVLTLFQDSAATLWAGTDCGLVSFDFDGPTSPCITTPTSAEGQARSTVYALAEDSLGRLWAGTEEGLRHLDRSSRQLVMPPLEVPLIESLVQSLFVDSEGILWVGYDSEGLIHLDPTSGIRRNFRHNAADRRSLSEDSIIKITQDHTGLLWFTTFLGVNRLDPQQRQFPTYRHQAEHPNSLNDNSIWALLECSSGDLWAGTFDRGLNRIDRSTGRVTHYLPQPEDDEALPNGSISALHEGADGTLWVGSWAGLSRMDIEKGTFRTLRHRPDEVTSLSSDTVQVVHEDRRQRLWVGTLQGLNRLQDDGLAFHRLGDDEGIPATSSINTVAEAADGGLWFGSTTSGLFHLPANGQEFTRLQHREGALDSLSSDRLASLYLDPEGMLWIGTYGSGLDRYDPESGEFAHYREQDGLPSNTILGILPDDQGHLWLSSYAGLGRLELSSGRCQSFSRAHGLQGDTFSDGSSFRGRDGTLYFGGTAGLNIIDPAAIVSTTAPPQVRLTEFRLLVNDDTQIAEDLYRQFLDGRVVLQHHQDLFAIDFTALDFAHAADLSYSYHLAGFDDTWISTGARKRFAQYSNLDAGDYLFEARARSSGGMASEAPARLQIVVLPPPWKTWWAYCLYSLGGLLLLSATVVGYRRRIERERSISRKLREVDRLKNAFIANTSHELRTPLHGMTGIAESILEGAAGQLSQTLRANLSLIVSSGRRLTSLVDDLLDFSKLGRDGIELERKPVALASICDIVISLSRPLLGDKSLDLHNRVPATLPPALADENRLLQILHNLVGNAIKFTPQGQVVLAAEVRGSQLVVKVSDSGIGIDKADRERIFEPFAQVDSAVDRQHGGAGLGLSVARELVQMHGGQLWLESNEPRGTVFCFTLPIAKDLEAPVAPMLGEPFSSPEGALQELATESPVQAFAAPPSAGGKDFHILIVDDESINRQLLVNILTLQGYRLSLATNGEEALRRVTAETFDLVLLDIMMPRMSGYEVCRILRQSYTIQELPVIFLTAKAQESDLVNGFAAGGNDYLTKPVTRLEIVSRVRAHLELVHMHRHLDSLVQQRTLRIAELNATLESRNTELEHFANTVSHELKSPLVTIKGFLEFARQDALSGDAESINRDFDRIASATQKMHQLLESLLAHPHNSGSAAVSEALSGSTQRATE